MRLAGTFHPYLTFDWPFLAENLAPQPMPIATRKTDTIRALPVLSLLKDDELSEILPAIVSRSYRPRALVFSAGDTVGGLYFIVSGQVRLTVEDHDARQFIISLLGPNDFFGELDLVHAGPQLQSAESQAMCELLFVPRASLLACLERNAGAAMFLMGMLERRLSEAHTTIANLALRDVYGRVARVLTEYAKNIDGECRIDLSTTTIAAMVGASREMVSRVVRDMAAQRIVQRRQRKLVILDRKSLITPAARGVRPGNPGERAGTGPYNRSRVSDLPNEGLLALP